MEGNLIHSRVAEFLKKWPPFNKLSNVGLFTIAEGLSIRFFESGEKVFSFGNPPGEFIYIVNQGSIRISSPGGELFDICDEGDMFGLRAALAGDAYKADAVAEENSLLYCIPFKIVNKILNYERELALYFASGFAAGVPLKGTPFRAAGAISVSDGHMVFQPDAIIVDGRKKVVSCLPEATVREAALSMSYFGVGSIIISDEGNHPIGIVTDKDLRTKIATGLRSIEDPIRGIMSSPVVCTLPNLTYSEYLIKMLKHGVHHLCITQTGMDNSPAQGLITEHDLLLEQGNNPAVIFREMVQTADWKLLRNLRARAQFLLNRYISQNIPVKSICEISSLLNDLLLRRIIQISKPKSQASLGRFAWLSLGSQGRREQVLFTDQDHALIIEKEEDREYFLDWAGKVVLMLEEVGFEKDQAGIMASNSKWCLSPKEWETLFDKWVTQPEPEAILHATIFFDFRVSAGSKELGDELREFLNQRLKNADLFKVLLAKDALKTPAPLSFFRNLVLEKDGLYKDCFDLKLRALLPMVDCGRLLAMDHGLSDVNTLKRFEQLAELDLTNKSLLEEAGEAFSYLLNFRFKAGFDNADSGRYINPGSLSKLQRQKLKKIFSIISDLQLLIKVRFKTGIAP